MAGTNEKEKGLVNGPGIILVVSAHSKAIVSRFVSNYRDGNPHNCDAANLVKLAYDKFVRMGYRNGKRRIANPFVNQSKPISQYDVNGKLIASFPSAVSAAQKTGIPRPYINRAAWSNKQKAGGFYWRYGKPAPRLVV